MIEFSKKLKMRRISLKSRSVLIKLAIFTEIIILCASGTTCYGELKRTLTIDSKSKLEQFNKIDLDLLKPIKVKLYHPSSEHKTFNSVGQKETLKVIPQVVSVLTAVKKVNAKSDYEADKVLSNLKILKNNRILYEKRGILGVTAFETNKAQTLITFAVINDQNADNFTTKSDLVLIDVKTGKAFYVKANIINTVNAPFSLDGKSLYYLNNNILFKLSLLNKKQFKVVEFLNQDYTILNIHTTQFNTFNVFFLKDIVEQQVFSVKFVR